MLLQYIRTAAERIEVELMSVDPELDLASEMTPSGRLTLCGPGTPLERCIEGKQLVVVSYDAMEPPDSVRSSAARCLAFFRNRQAPAGRAVALCLLGDRPQLPRFYFSSLTAFSAAS